MSPSTEWILPVSVHLLVALSKRYLLPRLQGTKFLLVSIANRFLSILHIALVIQLHISLGVLTTTGTTGLVGHCLVFLECLALIYITLDLLLYIYQTAFPFFRIDAAPWRRFLPENPIPFLLPAIPL